VSKTDHQLQSADLRLIVPGLERDQGGKQLRRAVEESIAD
jgi:hypothetical protein